ncbi:helix-turn-helix transcriptional regulator [Actinacidiphila guanduensis]|uniref:helix-turn-helix transcriptional regulator n=1 Tax=Actinacidiphila guanduensis TaxID=310781 RepID=UPI0015A21F76|nr:helix-turn-helix transcriptional regulator [Actinacidiphila guanduensis]
MDGDWNRLGKALAACRNSRGLSQTDFGRMAGISRTTVQGIERGKPMKRLTSALRRYAAGVGWPDGALEDVLAGREFTPRPRGDVRSASPNGLPLRVAHAIAEGKVLDTRIIALTPHADAVILVMAKPAATNTQMRTALATWSHHEPAVLGALTGTDPRPPGSETQVKPEGLSESPDESA